MVFTSTYQIRNIPHLTAGLNNKDDASEIADMNMSDCLNVEVDAKAIKSAGGYVDYGSATGPYLGGFHAKFQDGTNRLIRQRGTTLEYDDGSASWTECTLPSDGSPAATVVLSEIACSFAMMNNIILWSNGTDTVMSSTDGITWELQATLPKSKVLFDNGNNRILFMAQPASPSRIDWSDINDPLTIQSSAYQFIGKNDGQDIVDAVLLPSGAILLLKTNRFYSISDITFDMTGVDPIGEAPCVRYTAVATENSAIWAGPDGSIYEFDGTKASIINNNIESLDIAHPEVMRGVYHNNKYRLAVPNGSDDYNSYEYVVDRKVVIGETYNPYSITRNQRYIGCYIQEDREVAGVRRRRLYFGDGRDTAIGSPAAVPTTFVYINDIHNAGVAQGLNGEAQTCYFTTKFFTEDASFFLKRYTKYFVRGKADSNTNITVSYRFDPDSQWIDDSTLFTANVIDFEYEDGNSGSFTEGYSFSAAAITNTFKDLEKSGEEIRGIQFKVSWSSISDIEIFSQGYKFLTKRNFH